MSRYYLLVLLVLLNLVLAGFMEDSDALISTSYGRNSDRSARSLIVEGRDSLKVEILQYVQLYSSPSTGTAARVQQQPEYSSPSLQAVQL